ncbi:hypothetical protein MHU86_8842 [Fragilaria crotonensis]|nr:hypothetical protein MHU86_8842 [Fragilaria crotonensis]
MKCGQESASQPKRGDRKGLWGGIQGGVAPLVMGIMGARPSAIPCAFRRGSAALVGHPPLCEPGLIDGWGQECQCGSGVQTTGEEGQDQGQEGGRHRCRRRRHAAIAATRWLRWHCTEQRTIRARMSSVGERAIHDGVGCGWKGLYAAPAEMLPVGTFWLGSTL